MVSTVLALATLKRIKNSCEQTFGRDETTLSWGETTLSWGETDLERNDRNEPTALPHTQKIHTSNESLIPARVMVLATVCESG